MSNRRKDKYGAYLPDLDKEPGFYETAKFKKLNKKWTQKLADSGFEEQEDLNSPREWLKKHDSHYFRTKYDPIKFEENQRYFQLASQLIHTYKFNTKRDQKIWTEHVNGMSEREIAETYGWKEWTVRKCIRKVRQAIKRDAKEILEDLDMMKRSND